MPSTRSDDVEDDGFGIFLTGSYGVGKSSALEHLGDLFAAEGHAFSLFDVDWFHRSWPTSPEDARNVLVEAENLRDVWANYRRVGSRTPIIAGVIESHSDLQRYQDVFRRPLRVVQLVASLKVAERRLRARYDPARRPALDWHLADYERLTRHLADSPWVELTLNTDECSSAEVAAAVFGHFAPDLRSGRP